MSTSSGASVPPRPRRELKRPSKEREMGSRKAPTRNRCPYQRVADSENDEANEFGTVRLPETFACGRTFLSVEFVASCAAAMQFLSEAWKVRRAGLLTARKEPDA